MCVGRAGCRHRPLPAQGPPLLGGCSLARLTPTSFLLLLAEPGGSQMCLNATSRGAGPAPAADSPVPPQSRMWASRQHAASVFSPHFPVDSTWASAAAATPSLSREVGPGPAAGAEQGCHEITDFPVISLLCFRLARANFPVSIRAANLTLPARSHRRYARIKRHTRAAPSDFV